METLSSEPPALSFAAPKTWRLVAPDLAALDTVWHRELPFILWPIGPQPLLAHWLDEAVRRGVELIELYVADRPAEVRAWLGDCSYWSNRVSLLPIGAEDQAPGEAERVDHLPGQTAPPAPETAAALPQYWFALQKQWLAHRSPDAVTIDRLHPSGGWIGPQASVHPSARLTAPFWIGRRAAVGPDCQIGPNALVAEGAMLDRNVHIEEACVLARTYLGQNTRLFQAAADGSELLDLRRGCTVKIAEPFIMGPVVDPSSRPGWLSRGIALLCWLLIAPFARPFSWANYELENVRALNGEMMVLLTGRAGSLWYRRIPWLRSIAMGRMCWVGVHPRGADEQPQVPAEFTRTLRRAPPGLFSLADSHGCHELADLEEWIHATVQASAAARKTANAEVLRNLWRIAWSQKTDPSPV